MADPTILRLWRCPSCGQTVERRWDQGRCGCGAIMQKMPPALVLDAAAVESVARYMRGAAQPPTASWEVWEQMSEGARENWRMAAREALGIEEAPSAAG